MMTDDALHGRTVLSADGHAVGELSHLLIDHGKLELAGMEVKVRRNVAERLHLPHSFLKPPTLTIPAENVHSIGDVVILEVGLESLAAREPSRAPEQPAAANPRYPAR
jgi:sporulation protein YlmC with PRC-barrel domain